MDKKLIDFASEAGFPVNKEGGAYNFLIREKTGFIGSNDVELDSKIQKFADLLFEDFLSQWWVQRHREIKIERPSTTTKLKT